MQLRVSVHIIRQGNIQYCLLCVRAFRKCKEKQAGPCTKYALNMVLPLLTSLIATSFQTVHVSIHFEDALVTPCLLEGLLIRLGILPQQGTCRTSLGFSINYFSQCWFTRPHLDKIFHPS